MLAVALKENQNEEYGECTQCDTEINKKCLKSIPYTTLYIQYAQKLEQQNNWSRK